MATPNSVRIVHGAMDEAPGNGSSDSIVIRGVLDSTSLQLLQTAPYQREVAPLAQITDLVKAMEHGDRLPDVELGMRGEKYMEREDVFFLHDPIYIVDGLQRVTAAKHLINKGGKPRIGALVHMNTTEDWERERFRVLNSQRMKVSPNVLLRNLRKNRPAVELVYQICREPTFVLFDKVCWSQRMRRQDLITALTMLKSVGFLHAHIGPGRGNNVDDLSNGVQKIADRVGKNIFCANVREYFSLVDACWGIRRVAFREGASYLRSTFLMCLALILSRHENFWRGHRLFVEKELLRKIALFPVADPEVIRLASSGGKARELLYMLLIEHINSGKRSRRLVSRPDSPTTAHLPKERESHEVGITASMA